MKSLGLAFLLFALAACEKQPAPEENATPEPVASTPKQPVHAVGPTPSATSKPGDWRLKDYKPALDQRPSDKKH